MGTFIYGMPTISVEFDDRVLAHLKAVIVAKLRRGESFTLSWEAESEDGTGLASVWLHPAIPLQWEFDEPKEPPLNRDWLEELIRLSNTPSGLRVVPEPTPPAGALKTA